MSTPDATLDDRPAVHLEGVEFAWPGQTGFSLRVPEFRVEQGEKLFLSGASGSGKSTLLGLICGISVPSVGRIEVDGADLTAMSGSTRDRFRAERIGVIFQMFNLLPYVTPLENILLPLSFAPERRARLTDPKGAAFALADALELDRDLVAGARSDELSIGQQQRVAAARALIGGPPLVVADEPTSSLDATTQDAFLRLLMDHVADVGATLVMVSHDDRLAGHFDRVLGLEGIAESQRTPT